MKRIILAAVLVMSIGYVNAQIKPEQMRHAVDRYSVKSSTLSDVSEDVRKDYPWLGLASGTKIYAEAPEDFVIASLGLEAIRPDFSDSSENIAAKVKERYPWVRIGKNAQIYGMSPEQVAEYDLKTRKKNRLIAKRMKKVWEDYKAGKRDAKDAYVALRRLAVSTYGSDARAWGSLADEFYGKNKAQLGSRETHELSEETAENAKKTKEEKIRKEAEDTEIAEKAKNWVFDKEPVGQYFQSGDNVMVQYQYRLEFFRLGKGVSPKMVYNNETGAGRVEFYQSVIHINLQPQRVIHFGKPLNGITSRESSLDRLLVCTRHANWYVSRTSEEQKVLRYLKDHSTSPIEEDFECVFENPNADYDEFCGIVSTSGEVVYRFPVKHSPPEYVLQTIALSDDGQRALIKAGKYECGDGCEVIHPKEYFYWKAPDHFEKIVADEVGEAKAKQIIQGLY